MSKNTIKQHYVWRHYLRNFCFENESIFSLINLNKIVPNNLMNVAQERFFYKLHDIDENDLSFLNEFLNLYIPEQNELKEYLQTVLFSYKITILKKALPNKTHQENFEKNVQNDYFENHMTMNENYGKKFIEIKNLEDLKECFITENEFKTLLFLAIQFVRTKQYREKLIEEFKDKKVNMDKFWFFISFAIGNILATNLLLKRKHKILLIHNKSNLEFITSDQPIINLEEEKDEKGFAIYFKLYIPLSPYKSLILDFDSKENTVEELITTDFDYVKKLNGKIIKHSNMFIFSKSESVLTKIKNSI